MTEKLTCPNCNGTNITEISGFGSENKKLCLDCSCEWWESKRKPPEITPEMAWEWWCKRIFKFDVNYNHIQATGLEVQGRLPDDEWYCIVNAAMTKALGWQDMPPMTREDFANNANCSGIGKDGE